MSYLLFLDESGHDHRVCPYEVYGGIALHTSKIWQFIQGMKRLQLDAYGIELSSYGSEVKGHRLLDKHRFIWAAQEDPMEDLRRRRLVKSFFEKGQLHDQPTREEFTAYGQASLSMAQGVFELLNSQESRIFAVAIPRKVRKPDTFEAKEYLRKDIVFLLERYFYFLESESEDGLLVVDETDVDEDRRFVKKLERYFILSEKGRYRSTRIIPSPVFVSSDMTYPIQAADLCIYSINYGFRLPARGMDAPVREEVQSLVLPWLFQLQHEGSVTVDGVMIKNYSIVFVSNPFGRE